MFDNSTGGIMFDNFKVPKELMPSDPRFGCGPSLIPLNFLDELKSEGVHLLGTSHRMTPVKNLVKDMQEGLRKYFNIPTDYSVVLGNGGATLLFDMIGLGIVKKKVIHYTCGEFSQKWFLASKAIPWINAVEKAVDYGNGNIPEEHHDADLVCMTLNETSTGVQLDKMAKVSGDTLLAIDATSGAGQVPCDISKTDIFFFSPQKVFASEGGLWIAFLSPKARTRALAIAEDTTRYIPEIMSWKQAIANSDKNQTYNTPSITTIFFLRQQLNMMNKDGGYQAAITYAKKKADLIYGWATDKPYLSPFIQKTEFRSVAVATVDVDERIDVDSLIKVLGKQKVVYGIDSYRKLGRNQFRISLFHNVSYADLEKLTKLLSLAIEQHI